MLKTTKEQFRIIAVIVSCIIFWFFVILILINVSEATESATREDFTNSVLLDMGKKCELRSDLFVCHDGSIYNIYGYMILTVEQIYQMCMSNNPALQINCQKWAERLK